MSHTGIRIVAGSVCSDWLEIKSLDESKAAALALGAALDEENVSYAIIGGTACCLYGSTRGTIDLDVVVALPGSEVMVSGSDLNGRAFIISCLTQ